MSHEVTAARAGRCLEDSLACVGQGLEVEAEAGVEALRVEVGEVVKVGVVDGGSGEVGVEAERGDYGRNLVVEMGEDADAGVVGVAVEGEAEFLGEAAAGELSVVAIDGGEAEVSAELADLLFSNEGEALPASFVVALEGEVAVHLVGFEAEAVEDARLGDFDDDGFAGGAGAGVVADPVVFAGDADAFAELLLADDLAVV